MRDPKITALFIIGSEIIDWQSTSDLFMPVNMAIKKTTITEVEDGYWVEHEFFYGSEFIKKARFVSKTPTVRECIDAFMKFFIEEND